MNFEISGGTQKIGYKVNPSCVGKITVNAESEENWITASASDGTISVTVPKNTSGERDGTVYLVANGERCPKRTIAVHQAGDGCGCGNLNLEPSSLEWAYNKKDEKTITLTSGACISDITLNTLTNFTATLGSGVIKVSPKGENQTFAPYEETLEVTYKANGSTCEEKKTASLKQNPNECQEATCTCYLVSEATCEKVAATATTATVTWSYSAITWTTASTCTVSSSKTEGTSSTTVTFVEATCSDYSKSDTFSWEGHKACGDKKCEESDVEVTWTVNQTKPDGCDCTCNDLKLEKETVTVEVGKTVTVGYTADCLTTTSVTSSDDTIATVNGTNGIITIEGKKKGTPTVTISGTANVTSCTKTINVTVDCQDITITPNNSSGNCSGGTVTFRAS